MSTPDPILLSQAKGLCFEILAAGRIAEEARGEATIAQLSTSAIPTRHRLHLICALKEAQAGLNRKSKQSIQLHLKSII